MAFDISTAKPVAKSSKFDISTAKPVAKSSKFDISTAKPIEKQKTPEELAQQEIKNMGAGERFDLAVGGGLYKGWLGAKDLVADLGIYGDPAETQAAIDENEKYLKPLEATTGGKVGSLIGQALPITASTSQIPIAGAGVLARYGTAALGGAAQGAITAAPTGESRASNVALGTIGSVGGQAVLDAFTPAIVSGVKKASDIIGRFKSQATPIQIETVLTTTIGKADWDAMTADAKKAAIDLASDPAALQGLTAKGIANKAILENLPIPINKATQGQITGSFDQLRNEDMLSKQTFGAPIRDVVSAQDEILQANIGEIGRSGITPRDASETGRKIREALQQKTEVAKKITGDKYDFARSTSGDLSVNVDPLRKLLDENRAAAISESSLQSIGAKLDEITDEKGFAALKNLEGVRKLAQELSKDKSSGYYMGQIKGLVDDIEESSGSNAYKDAIGQAKAAFREFENRKVSRRLLAEDAPNSLDPKVADEDVFIETVLKSSDKQFADFKRTLLGANEQRLRGQFKSESEARKAGIDAYKAIRGETARYILEKATGNQQGTVSENALRKVVNDIGKEKLKEIFGPRGANQLEMLVKAAKIVKVKPPGATNVSGSGDRVVTFLLQYLPGGSLVEAAVKTIAAPAQAAMKSGKVASGASPLIKSARNQLFRQGGTYRATNALLRTGGASGAINYED